MHRIILHWTGGAHRSNDIDRAAYHFIVEHVDGVPRVVAGDHPPEANEILHYPHDVTTYAAHTGRANTKSIGVAVAGMRRAQERPFDPGPSPMFRDQIDLLCRFVADLSVQYGIPVQRTTVLSHAEVEQTLGIVQKNKWDIMWLPGMDAVGDPIEVGDELRRRIVAKRRSSGMVPQALPGMQRKVGGLFKSIGAALSKLLGGRK